MLLLVEMLSDFNPQILRRVRVRVRSNEFLVHRGGDIVEIVVADIV